MITHIILIILILLLFVALYYQTLILLAAIDDIDKSEGFASTSQSIKQSIIANRHRIENQDKLRPNLAEVNLNNNYVSEQARQHKIFAKKP